MDRVKASIIDGRITVVDFTADGRCPS